MARERLHAQRGRIAIVGAAESDEVGKLPDKSALMLHAEAARNALADAGLRPRVKVLVGGAPVTRAWADQIGADGYGEDAVGAVKVARGLMGL